MFNRITASFLLALAAGAVQADEPLAAIPWLRDAVRQAAPPASPLPGATGLGRDDAISVSPLSGPNPDATGLVAATGAGLPADFWGPDTASDLAALLASQPVLGLPQLNALLHRILVAELDPPAGSGPGGALFLARIDKLVDLGALEPALALLEREGATTPAAFSRWFDVALLTGYENDVCAEMQTRPALAPGLPARIFCLARQQEWPTAANTLEAGRALGEIPSDEAELLARFLEPELAEMEPTLAPPARMTPLVWRMQEAIGEPLPSTSLPLEYAQADLRANTGWKARLEAGERLARSGGIDPNLLHGLYTEQAAAASGGVWERVRAIQSLDRALDQAEAGATTELSLILPQVWAKVAEAELEIPVAAIYGPRLSRLQLDEPAGTLAHRICLLAPTFADHAQTHRPTDLTDIFLKGLAMGNLRGLTPPDRLAGAIRDGFRAGAVPQDLQAMLGSGRKGAAVLHAMLRISNGAQGDLRGVVEGIGTLRAAGLEMEARSVGLQLMLLDRRG